MKMLQKLHSENGVAPQNPTASHGNPGRKGCDWLASFVNTLSDHFGSTFAI